MDFDKKKTHIRRQHVLYPDSKQATPGRPGQQVRYKQPAGHGQPERPGGQQEVTYYEG